MERPPQLEEFIRGASRLPVLPEATIRLLNAVDAPDTSANDAAEIIEADPALAARIMKLANSPFYGQRGRIASIRGAVVVLGFKTIRSLALAVWTHTLRGQTGSEEELQRNTPIFAHGLTVGVASGLLAERVDRSLAEDAFLAGLLHDIGRVALFAQLGKEYRTGILEPAEREGFLAHEREREVLGFDHRELGAALMSSWCLPPFLVDVAEQHHDREILPRDRFFVAAVALADALSTRMRANVALGSPRPMREDLEPFFGLPDPPARSGFLELCAARVAELSEALE